MGQTNDSFVFYYSFYEALSNCDDKTRLECYDAITKYALTGELTELEGVSKIIFTLIKPNLDANAKRKKDGEKGGRPPKETKGSKTKKPQVNEEETIGFYNEETIGYEDEKPNEDIDEEINEEINEEIKKEKDKKKKEPKKMYGEYKHVRLTDTQYQRLCNDYGEPAVIRGIKNVDEYCQTKGKTYSDYNLVLRGWGIKDPKLTKPLTPVNQSPPEEEPSPEWEEQFV